MSIHLLNNLVVKHCDKSEANLLAEDQSPALHASKLWFLVRLVRPRELFSRFCRVQHAHCVQPLNDLVFLAQVFLVLVGPELLVLGPCGVLFLQFAVLQGHTHPKTIGKMIGNNGYKYALLQRPSSSRRI